MGCVRGGKQRGVTNEPVERLHLTDGDEGMQSDSVFKQAEDWKDGFHSG